MKSGSRRRYTLGRRAETAAETRQRLVEATASLHDEKGISGTSLRDIALRAGVSVGTAYHHFPTYDDAIRACGDHTMRLYPPPDVSIFDGLHDVDARVAAFVSSLFRYFDRCPWLEEVRLERRRFAPIEEVMAAMEQHFLELARAAVRGDDSTVASILVAISDITPFHILRRSGISPEEAANRITEVFLSWLHANDSRREITTTTKRRRR